MVFIYTPTLPSAAIPGPLPLPLKDSLMEIILKVAKKSQKIGLFQSPPSFSYFL